MEEDGRSIRDVVVAGGGIVGWSAAAALKRHLPALNVTIVATPPPPDALADRIISTLPSIREFHRDIGLGEADTVGRAGSAFRLGTCFEGWGGKDRSYVHAYGDHGQPFGATSFHNHWVRFARDGAAPPFDKFSPAALMGRAGRFVHPQGEAGSPLATFDYGLQINPQRYLQMMRAYGRHLGVTEQPGAVAEVRLRADDGFVEGLRLDDGSEIAGHLFVDCTGPGAAIRLTMDERFQAWDRWLSCDRILLAEAPPPAELPVLDKAVAMTAGWRWESASPAIASHGFVYSSAQLSDSKAQRTFRNAAGIETTQSPVPLRQGRRPQPWLRNCVAVGDAAVAVEPLEWTNLHLAHSAIDRIVSMMPDRDCAPVELAEYNRQAEAEADRVRDFLILHYVASGRSDPFWSEASAKVPPDSLAHTLTLFRERGRLPFYEEETFSRDSWLAVLLGQGVIPHRPDPLTEGVPAAVAEASMERMRSALEPVVAALPSHSAYVRSLVARVQR